MQSQSLSKNKISKLHALGAILTVFGVSLFAYFVYQAGVGEIWNGITRLGFGFLVIILLHAIKVASRAFAWTLCVEKPYQLSFFSACKAVVIAEALNAMIPLGILISGTSKAVAVRKQLPLVVGLSSVAVENLFYSLATSLLILGGAIAFLLTFQPEANVAAAGYALIAILVALIISGFMMVVQQWKFASATAEWLYGKGLAKRVLHGGRAEVRRFEELIYGFYRRQPGRFLPVFLLQIVFHALGVLEVWYILQAISDSPISFSAAFLLESVNRIILVVFKLIPFVMGVDEAGASFITDTLAIGAGVGVTLAIIRKARVLFWVTIGVLLILRSGLSIRQIAADASLVKAEAASSGETQ